MTDEEYEVRRKQFVRAFNDVARAREAIVADSKGERSVNGQIVCPVDGGTLNYSVKANGHIWGACSNDDCVRWME